MHAPLRALVRGTAHEPLRPSRLRPTCPLPNRRLPCPARRARAEIISRLQSFTHQNRVKCLLMTIAAHHLSDEEIGGLRKVRARCCCCALLLS